MAMSPEYPDLQWMPPKSWTDANRTQVQLVVIHATEGSEHAQSAEDGASYDQERTDGTSTHYFHDSDSTVQCVRTEDQAHAARTQGNKRGIQHELCADAADTWNDSYHQAVLRRAAKQAARDAKKWGIPIKKLSPAQVSAGNKGFCGHADITYAFPEDNGTHTDPGSNFPWSQFLAMVEDEGDDVSSADVVQGNKDYDAKYRQGDSPEGVSWYGNNTGVAVWDNQYMPNPISGGKTQGYRLLGDLATQIMLVKKDLAELAGKDFTDEAAIVQGVLAGLADSASVEEIADIFIAALPADLATQIANEILAKQGQAMVDAAEDPA
jgi:N-acetyl-anhydromuramyl-L-alanine amidase AmpD